MDKSTGRARVYCGRSGYLLVVTLLCIAMAGAISVGLARQSISMASVALIEESRLQTKWGAASCQRFAFRNQRVLLSTIEGRSETGDSVVKPTARSTATVMLGDQQFSIRLDDESAKLDLNWVFSHSGPQRVGEIIQEMTGTPLEVDLLPMEPGLRRGPNEHAFESWGQIFCARDANSSELPGQIRTSTRQLTCWSRKLNVIAAPEEVIRQHVEVVAGKADTAALAKLNDDRTNLDDIIIQMSMDERSQQRLISTLGNRSTSQSVWVEVVSGYGTFHTLAIREQHSGVLSRMKTFGW